MEIERVRKRRKRKKGEHTSNIEFINDIPQKEVIRVRRKRGIDIKVSSVNSKHSHIGCPFLQLNGWQLNTKKKKKRINMNNKN